MYSFRHTYRQASWKYQTVHTLQSGDARQVYVLNRYKQSMPMTCLSARAMVKIFSSGTVDHGNCIKRQTTRSLFVYLSTLKLSVTNNLLSTTGFTAGPNDDKNVLVRAPTGPGNMILQRIRNSRMVLWKSKLTDQGVRPVWQRQSRARAERDSWSCSD